jgi:hypothetical protein
LTEQTGKVGRPIWAIAGVTAAVVALIVFVTLATREDRGGELNAAFVEAECPLPARQISFLGTLVMTPVSEAGSESFDRIPEGSALDPETAAAVEMTIQSFIDCSNSGDVLRWLSLYSDSYLRNAFDPEGQLDSETADKLIASIATPEAVPLEDAVTLVGTREMVQMPDGRVAVVLETDGGDPNPEGTDINLFILEKNGDRWLISNAVSDADLFISEGDG